MISFRHHVVSLVAVFLALAVGVALGGGPLGSTDNDTADRRTSTGPGDTGDPGGAGPAGSGGLGSPAAAYAERFAAAAGTRLYGGGLASSPVAVVWMPTADNKLLKDMSTQIEAAGGRVTGRFGVREALLDPEQRSLVDSLGSQLITQLADPTLDGSASTYDRIGQLLGVAVSTREKTEVPATAAALSARDTFSGASFVASPPAAVANAPLVLVVLGDENGIDEAAAELRTSLISGLAATSAGVVVLGDEASAASGTLAGLRGQTPPGVLATVDGSESELGQVGAVLALIGALAGRGGAFGAASADGALPLG